MDKRRAQLVGALAFGVVACLYVVPARAQEAPVDPAAVTERRAAALGTLADQLGSNDLKQRMDADEKIRTGPYSLKDLEAVLRKPGLSLEQRERLMAIASHRFETEPRGAMGIAFNLNAPDTRGALVESPKRGFNAWDVLRANDRILRAGGEVIDKQKTLRWIIVAHDPGDEVPLVVERDGSTIDVKVRLGDFSTLGQPQDPVTWREAWEYRSRGYVAPAEAKPIESGLFEASWAVAPEIEDDAELLGQLPWVRARMISQGNDHLGVTAGGEARSGLSVDGIQQEADGAKGAQALFQGQPNAAQVREQLVQQRATIVQTITLLDQQLRSGKVPADQRATVERQILQYRQILARMDQQTPGGARRATPPPKKP